MDKKRAAEENTDETSSKRRSTEKGTNCAICQEPLSEILDYFLICGHGFHTNCFTTFLLRKNDCPVCGSADIGREANTSKVRLLQEERTEAQINDDVFAIEENTDEIASKLNITEEQSICEICKEPFCEIPETVLICGHRFHANCLNPLLERSTDCPMCGTIFSRCIATSNDIKFQDAEQTESVNDVNGFSAEENADETAYKLNLPEVQAICKICKERVSEAPGTIFICDHRFHANCFTQLLQRLTVRTDDSGITTNSGERGLRDAEHSEMSTKNDYFSETDSSDMDTDEESDSETDSSDYSSSSSYDDIIMSDSSSDEDQDNPPSSNVVMISINN